MYDFVMQFPVVLESMQGVPAGLLVAFLLGVALAATTFVTVDNNLGIEKWRAVLRFCFIQQDIFKGYPVFLTPLQKLALEVDFQIGHLVYVNEAVQYFLCYEAFAVSKPPVQIDGTNECLESISGKVVIVHVIAFVFLKEFVQTYLCSELSKRLTLHDFAAGVCQETFTLAGKVMINNLANDSIQYSIAQEFQPFVVDGDSALGVGRHGLMHQCLLIEANLVRIESQHITKGAIKLLFLTERQLYRVYQINGRHSLILRIS